MKIHVLVGVVTLASSASASYQKVFRRKDDYLDPAHQEPSWWAKVDDHLFTRPLSSKGMSQKIEDYYYAVGPLSGVRPELLQHRVAGSGQAHIFHLPGGPDLAGLRPRTGNRRSSISALMQLRQGLVLNSRRFPLYQTSSSYQNPLDAAGRAKEQEMVSYVSEQNVMLALEGLEKLPTPSEPTRSYRNVQATDIAVQYLKGELSAMGFTVCVQDYSYSSYAQYNVVAYMPGTSSSEGAVIMGAHFDSRPFSGAAPGAVDNGSGVAALLAVAKAFNQSGVRPKRPVYLVAFGTEEMGLYGSKAFVDSLLSETLPEACQVPATSPRTLLQKSVKRVRKRESKHRAIVMDEVGWRHSTLESDTVNLEAYDWNADVMDHLAEASKEYNGANLTVVHSSNPFGSDHMSFLDEGIHCALAINGDDEDYPYYHTSSDDISQVNWPLLAKIAKMSAGGLFRLAEE
mmetsp:Transcript_27000/g.46874  ORF Transcript_27000/g.46874 Transcript_27000/m.46874 type:complete len:457 (-) Transcript_27000:128-1498(-)